MAWDQAFSSALLNLTRSADRLKALSFDEKSIEHLLGFAALVTFRTQLGRSRPSLVGFIGCTGTGKSTIFNSIAKADISGIGWRAHNTHGPVALSNQALYNQITQYETINGKVLFPNLGRNIISQNHETGILGSTEALHWVVSDQHAPGKVILIDLPDINTTRSREERLLALEILPWLDRVVFVMDEETFYHRDYVDVAQEVLALHQPRICVLNNRGRDRVDLEHHDFQDTMKIFRVDTIHVLPLFQNGTRFTSEREFKS